MKFLRCSARFAGTVALLSAVQSKKGRAVKRAVSSGPLPPRLGSKALISTPIGAAGAAVLGQ
jgi:hypothetical protein